MNKKNKGRNLTSDYIPYDQAMAKGRELLMDSKKTRIGFMIIFAVNSGLRISDILSRQHSDFDQKRPGDQLRIMELKTKKPRIIDLNQKITDSYRFMRSLLDDKEAIQGSDPIFKSQKGTVYRLVSINTILKKEFQGVAPQISSHSLRKGFGRHVYEQNGRSEDALVYLSEIFQHTSLRVTRTYLGIRREEIKSIYMNL